MERDCRDVELVLLGAILASKAFAQTAFARLRAEDLQDRDLAAVFVELQAGAIGEAGKQWLAERGAAVNGKAVDGVLEAIEQRAKRRRLELLARRLSLAVAANCPEEIESCREELNREQSKNERA